jgi:rhamnogalacturonyl hydrolase YesR
VSAILIGQTQSPFLPAAQRQIEHLLTAVPRWPNGAISHREDYPELWADFIYMAPPALAYWAIQDANETLLRVAVEQCVLYRDVLRVPHGANAAGLWHHIIGPQNQDLGIWSTGNAWAAAGMARVLATARKSRWASALTSDMSRLTAAIRDILDAAIALDKADIKEPLLRNYLNDTSWFGELSGTTLLVATTYRMAKLTPAAFGHRYLAWADEKRKAIVERINQDGLLSPVINPLDWSDMTPGTASPEAQSFAVLMFAAYRDFHSKS